MKTYSAKASEIERKWFVIDAEGVVLIQLVPAGSGASTSLCLPRIWTVVTILS